MQTSQDCVYHVVSKKEVYRKIIGIPPEEEEEEEEEEVVELKTKEEKKMTPQKRLEEL